jgi:hypothetical protein
VSEETGTKLGKQIIIIHQSLYNLIDIFLNTPGQKIGYSIRFDEKVTVGMTRVKYLTEG